MKSVILPIYWHTDDTALLDDLGAEFKITDCEVRHVHFYQICAVVERKDNGVEEGCTVFIPGDKFICKYTKDKVIAMIDKAFN